MKPNHNTAKGRKVADKGTAWQPATPDTVVKDEMKIDEMKIRTCA